MTAGAAAAGGRAVGACWRRILISALCAACLAVSMTEALAQGQPLAGDDDSARRLVVAGRVEQQAARLALERGLSPSVKGYAEDVLAEYPRIFGALEPIARRFGIEGDGAQDPRARATLDELSDLKGAAFDNAYAQQVGVQWQGETVALLEQGAQAFSDPELRSYASSRLPKLRVLLERARKLTAEIAPVQ